jgi:hypothetical protein
LRSLANVPHEAVHAVGATPAWVRNVEVITPQTWPTKWRALVGDLLVACQHLEGRTLLLVDDDMFVMAPVKDMPTLHAGPLAEHLKTKRGSYARSMGHTMAYLQALGVRDPLSYELHVPMVIDATAMAATLEAVVHWPQQLQARTVYGNLQRVGGKRMDDVKVYDKGPLPERFVSSAPRAWSWIHPLLDQQFNAASRYEA